MSPRAAWRLESLGFTQVFDYVAGKADWLASGLPTEGKLALVPRAGHVARRDAPTCYVTDRLSNAQARVQATGGTICIVVNSEGVVLGRLRKGAFDSDPTTIVEDIMESGPTTIRPDTLLESITKRMQERKVDGIVVTTSDGRLIGVLYRKDAEHYLDGVQTANEGGSQLERG
jgi:CBS domain-containing protein